MFIHTSSVPTIITHKDIAQHCGLSFSTVRKIMSSGYTKKYGSYSDKTIERVKTAAQELGYMPKGSEERRKMTKVRVEAKKELERAKKYWRNGNFHSGEEETQRMIYLRNNGHTNAAIAKKTGRTIKTVLNKIGRQPKEYTKESFRLASERLRLEREAQRKRMLSVKVSEYEAYLTRVQEEERSVVAAEAEAQRVANEAAKKREEYAQKVIVLEFYRKEAEAAAKELGVKIG